MKTKLSSAKQQSNIALSSLRAEKMTQEGSLCTFKPQFGPFSAQFTLQQLKTLYDTKNRVQEKLPSVSNTSRAVF